MSTGTGDFKQLLYASRDGDLDAVIHWMRYDVDVNFRHPEFMFAPLHISIRNRHLDVARFLLENGADPHLSEGDSTDTPLSIAEANNDPRAIALLAEFGVNIDKSWFSKWRDTLQKRLFDLLSY